MLSRLKKKNKKKNNLKIQHLLVGVFFVVIIFTYIKFKTAGPFGT